MARSLRAQRRGPLATPIESAKMTHDSALTPSPAPSLYTPSNIMKDLAASAVVFVVALPLCLGIAMASGAPLFSGVISGIIGGILVGLFSGSHTSVSGPGNSMMAIAAAQIAALGSFQSFLLAVVIAGGMQIALGIMRAGLISAFFPPRAPGITSGRFGPRQRP